MAQGIHRHFVVEPFEKDRVLGFFLDRVVSRARATGFLRAIIAGHAQYFIDGRAQLPFVARKALVDPHAALRRHHGNQIARRYLLVDEFFHDGLQNSDVIGMGVQIVHHEHDRPMHIFPSGIGRRRELRLVRPLRLTGRCTCRKRNLIGRWIHVGEPGDLLRLAVFEDREIFRLQVGDVVAFRIGHKRIHFHQVHRHANHRIGRPRR